MASGTKAELRGVWGSSATDVFAVGGFDAVSYNSVFQFDGTTWRQWQGGDFRETGYHGRCRVHGGIGGAPSGEVYVVGEAELVLVRSP